jgi:hypothetical protein
MVRVGDTVRRPLAAGSNFVHALLLHLEPRGFAGAPRFLGLDKIGREVLTFVPGQVPAELESFSGAQCAASVGELQLPHHRLKARLLAQNIGRHARCCARPPHEHHQE